MKTEHIDIARVLMTSFKWGVIMLLIGAAIVVVNNVYDTVNGAMSAIETRSF